VSWQRLNAAGRKMEDLTASELATLYAEADAGLRPRERPSTVPHVEEMNQDELHRAALKILGKRDGDYTSAEYVDAFQRAQEETGLVYGGRR
jgi:hypothetical protein